MNNYFNNVILYFLIILILHLVIKIYLLDDMGINFQNARENYTVDNDRTYHEHNSHMYDEDTVSHGNENAFNSINNYGNEAKNELLNYLDDEKKNTDGEMHTLLTKSTNINKDTIDNSFNNLGKDIYTFDEVPTQQPNDKSSGNIDTGAINNIIQGYDDFDNSYYTL